MTLLCACALPLARAQGPIAPATSGYVAALTWQAPQSSPDPVAGYNVYRAAAGSGAYDVVGSTAAAVLAFNDGSAGGGASWDYVVESVDAGGNESVPSNTATVTIPGLGAGSFSGATT
jgi:fibronectin type 3 domain-containing protein